MIATYILRDHEAVAEPDLDAWARWWFDNDKNHIVRQEVVGSYWISTVFLGLDPPLLFETRAFGKHASEDRFEERCSTWDEAVAQHERIVAEVSNYRDAGGG